MSSLAKNFYASKELEQAQTSEDRLEVRCQVSNNYINQKYGVKKNLWLFYDRSLTNRGLRLLQIRS